MVRLRLYPPGGAGGYKEASVITPRIASQWYKSELCLKGDLNNANDLKSTNTASTLRKHTEEEKKPTLVVSVRISLGSISVSSLLKNTIQNSYHK